MFGNILGAIGSVVGGIFGNKSQQAQIDWQNKYAKNRLQWLAKDAKAAGLHPLAALGAGAPTYTPVGGNPLGAGIAEGMAQLGAASEAQVGKEVSRSYIEVNKAQADLIRAQTNTILAEAEANVRGGTTGARNVSDPTKSPMLGAEVNQRVDQAFSDLGAAGAPPSFEIQVSPSGQVIPSSKNPVGLEEIVAEFIRDGNAFGMLANWGIKNVSEGQKSYFRNLRRAVRKGNKTMWQAAQEIADFVKGQK